MNRSEYIFCFTGKIFCVTAIFLFVIVLPAFSALSPGSDTSLQKRTRILYGYYQQGFVLPTNQFVRGNNIKQQPINNYGAVSAGLSWQTTGARQWEQLWNYPRLGAGFYKPLFSDAAYLGNPAGIYGSMAFALKRWTGSVIFFETSLGFQFNWNSYLEDKYNLAIGARQSISFSTAFLLEKKLWKGLKASLGAGFVHFSNGSLKVPNLGINVFTPRIGLEYAFDDIDSKFIYRELPEFSRRREYNLSAFTGFRNILYYGNDVDSLTQRRGVYYKCYGLAFSYNYQVSHKSKFGIGIMTDYLGYVNSTISSSDGRLVPNPASLKEGFEISIFPSYELVINRASVLLQPGFYLHRADYPEKTPATYQRIGLKYYITDNLNLGLNMRAHYWSIADFIEWNIGYSFR